MTRERFTPCYCCGYCDVLTPQDHDFVKTTFGYCTKTNTIIEPDELRDDTQECNYAWELSEPTESYESYLFPDYSHDLGRLTVMR